NNGDGTLNWSASTDQSWLRLGATSGTAPANLSIAANPAGLPVGQYTGHVTVTTSDAANSPQTVLITLNVVSAKTLQFSDTGYRVNEGDGHATITVTRTGDTSSAATVDYKTVDTDTFTYGCADTD